MGRGNGITVRDGDQWTFHHLRKGSIGISSGQSVFQGDVIGRVGNSGMSSGPHLHVEVGKAGSRRLAHLILKDVTVGLNSDDLDPWAVVLPEWEVESGFFVRSASPKK